MQCDVVLRIMLDCAMNRLLLGDACCPSSLGIGYVSALAAALLWSNCDMKKQDPARVAETICARAASSISQLDPSISSQYHQRGLVSCFSKVYRLCSQQ